MAKPVGARFNCAFDCSFYFDKARLYPGRPLSMPDEVRLVYIEELFAAHRVPGVTGAWQGGEPTLMGLDFFRRSVACQLDCARPGTRIENTFQTSGILFDDEWCRFFRENGFQVGLSMDGPKDLHEAHRRDAASRGPAPAAPGEIARHRRAGTPSRDPTNNRIPVLQREIRIESTQGEGSNFFFTLSAALPPASDYDDSDRVDFADIVWLFKAL